MPFPAWIVPDGFQTVCPGGGNEELNFKKQEIAQRIEFPMAIEDW